MTTPGRDLDLRHVAIQGHDPALDAAGADHGVADRQLSGLRSAAPSGAAGGAE